MEKELVKTALVGTQRMALGHSVRQKLAEWGISSGRPEEEAVLSAAALVSRMKKAQYEGRDMPPGLAPLDLTAERVCCTQSIRHLHMMLGGTFADALPEFLHHLKQEGKSIPPEVLPGLLDKSMASEALWSGLRPSIGPRGEWLLLQNPAWEKLAPGHEDIDWEYASSDQRARHLRSLRRANPQAALDLVKADWDNEDLRQRLRFMKSLSVVRDTEWEAFFEALLDDRRRELRAAAAQWLARKPDSRLVSRMFERLRVFIRYRKRPLYRGELDIELPEQLDEGMVRDGVNPRMQWAKMGMKASRLGQMVAVIPPGLWSREFGLPAAACLDVFAQTEYGGVLLEALSRAAHIHKAPGWAEALVRFKIEKGDAQRWQHLNVSKLMEQLPEETFNRIALQGLENKKCLLNDNSPIVELLRNNPARWEDELTLSVIRHLKEWLSRRQTNYWSGWHLKNMLKAAAYRSNPSLHGRLAKSWAGESHIWADWERDTEEFLSVLSFRGEMIKGLVT